MTVKEYMQRGWKAERRVRALEDRLEILRARAERVKSSAPKRTPGGGGRARQWEDAIDALCDEEAALVEEIAALCRVQAELRQAVAAVESPRLKTLLELRYFSYLEWADIAEVMGYDVRTMHRMHGKALRILKMSLNVTSKTDIL